eukprot:jgi/Chlat1/9073/Chrsp94S08322
MSAQEPFYDLLKPPAAGKASLAGGGGVGLGVVGVGGSTAPAPLAEDAVIAPSYDFIPPAPRRASFPGDNGKEKDLSSHHNNEPAQAAETMRPTRDAQSRDERGDYDRATQVAVELTMKKYTEQVLAAMTEVHARMDRLEKSNEHITESVKVLCTTMEEAFNEKDARLRVLENTLREVQRGVQLLRDKQELAETQAELAKASSLSVIPRPETPQAPQAPPPPAPPAQREPTPLEPTQQSSYSLPPQQQQQQQPSQVPPPTPPPPQQQPLALPPPQQQQQQPQLPYGPPRQDTHYQAPSHMQHPMQEQHYQGPPPQMQPPPPTPPQSHYGPPAGHPHAGPPQYNVPPPQAPQMYDSNAPHMAPQMGPPGPAPGSQYGQGPSFQYAPVAPPAPPPPQQAIPTAFPLRQAMPAPPLHAHQVATPAPAQSAPLSGGPTQLSTSRVPVDKVIDDVAAMGFSKDQVRAVVRKLTENGQSVDLNIVLDRLMNGEAAGDTNARRGWFGR